jgi:hypothetical protein
MTQNYAILGTAIATFLISAIVSAYNPKAGEAIAKQADNLIAGCVGALGMGAIAGNQNKPKE